MATVQEKTQIKTKIPRISGNFFHQESHDPNHRLIKSKASGEIIQGIYCILVGLKHDTVADSSSVNTQHFLQSSHNVQDYCILEDNSSH